MVSGLFQFQVYLRRVYLPRFLCWQTLVTLSFTHQDLKLTTIQFLSRLMSVSAQVLGLLNGDKDGKSGDKVG